MNARMLEIAVQAGLKKDHASDREYVGDFDWRLFGDLIVEECLCLLKESKQHYTDASKHVVEGHEEYYMATSAKEYALSDAISYIMCRFEN